MALSNYGIPDIAGYDQQRDDLSYRYNTDAATNAYGRFLSQQRGDRQLAGMQTSFNRALPQQYAQYGQRGLAGSGLQSGTAQRSMQNYLGDYSNAYGNAQQDITQGLQQYDLTAAQNSAYYQSSLADIERQKQQDIANAALGVEALRPYLGGT